MDVYCIGNKVHCCETSCPDKIPAFQKEGEERANSATVLVHMIWVGANFGRFCASFMRFVLI